MVLVISFSATLSQILQRIVDNKKKNDSAYAHPTYKLWKIFDPSITVPCYHIMAPKCYARVSVSCVSHYLCVFACVCVYLRVCMCMCKCLCMCLCVCNCIFVGLLVQCGCGIGETN